MGFKIVLTAVLLSGAHAVGAPPTPDLVDFSYGPYKANTLDLWKAASPFPTPLFMYIHGGGFDKGDKSEIDLDLAEALLKRGVSVMTINYRLTPEVTYPDHYLDCARALQ